ncbi:unnamed protein product [Caenorhabditis auriculariae]|uniref:Phospholipid/glycerol acyltransferase domain-containing protein n=1 Tax=Caenorhabditis auriculariae TaxID=2777116 RepID=A0A8S1HDC5_9PELO|nr:unnamed protein product [Caenorhabditis auriculariae]
MKSKVAGLIFAILVFLSSLLGSVFLLFPFIPLAYFAPKVWREIADRLLGYWLTFPASLVEWIFESKFFVTGDLIQRDEPAIILMNHRTRLDWLFLWNALYKMDPWLLTTGKISLKAPLKKIPGAGWAMSAGAFIFLERNFESDKSKLEDMMRYYKACGKNYQILFFAEGTDRGERAVLLSHAYADKNNLPRYDYVLHPRTTGFAYLLEIMKRENYIKYVYDVSVAYRGEVIDTEAKLVKNGNFPEEVHFDLKRYSVEEIDEDVSVWLQKLWSKKEEKLKRFYQGNLNFEPSGEGFQWPIATTGLGYSVAFAFWIFSSLLWIYFIYAYFFVKVYFLAASLFYLYGLHAHNEMSSPGEPPVISGGQPLVTRLKGWLFGIGMLSSSLFGMLFVITPVMPLALFKPILWRKLLDRLVGMWVIMPGALMSFMFGASVKVQGHKIDHSEPALIIMNHRTRLDWLFFWNALFQMDPWLCTSEKISLKGMLKKVPGAGWAMQAACYIFLDRSFETDKSSLDKIITYFADTGYNYQLLLFPEGTDKCPKATERSRLHAERKSLVHYDYVLHPRITGFVHIVQSMRKLNYIKYLYDVSIGFGDAIVQSEIDLVLHGACPKEVYYQIRKLPIDSLPSSDEGLAEWLVELWKEKERKLKTFYTLPQKDRHFPPVDGGEQFGLDDYLQNTQKFVVSFWLLTTLFWTYMFFESALMFYIALVTTVIYTVICKCYGGLEHFAIKMFYDRKSHFNNVNNSDNSNGNT